MQRRADHPPCPRHPRLDASPKPQQRLPSRRWDHPQSRAWASRALAPSRRTVCVCNEMSQSTARPHPRHHRVHVAPAIPLEPLPKRSPYGYSPRVQLVRLRHRNRGMRNETNGPILPSPVLLFPEGTPSSRRLSSAFCPSFAVEGRPPRRGDRASAELRRAPHHAERRRVQASERDTRAR